MKPTRVLVVDDEPKILRVLRTSLRTQGFEISTAPNGETAIDLLTKTLVDLVILDLGLPGMDGQEVIERLRSWSDVPVIVLSVREGQADKIAALDAGADDYVTKPFAIEELLARIRAVRRRLSPEPEESVLHFDDLEIDLARRLVTVARAPVHLTPTEYSLLETLSTNPGKLLTHRWLLEKVWGPAYSTEAHYIRVYIQQLRSKLGDDVSHPKWILTEPGVGYRWRSEARSIAAPA